ncbi:unnamed protein product [Darwinula stevensoni]|uniref:Galactose mutarotase n=1 Tax=Darwinula stevensoni TaxID=69355 RepID=A0A7R8XBU6_9CRUS|nr:unnamed protein product [Darwinula stevensoni]CAG0886877.1 unnamed protein product [Darwinula stevensoni]
MENDDLLVDTSPRDTSEQLQYPYPKKKITSISIHDHWSDGTGGQSKILEGGVDHDRVKIKLQSSHMFRGYEFTVIITGATIVSWRVNNQEQLFVSKQAIFDGKKAIRGGVPFVFPQFGSWAIGPQHGFARITQWALEKPPERLPSGDVEAIFSLQDSDFTRGIWNHAFRLSYRLILREKELHFNVGVYNPGAEAFSFTILLHTYFKAPDVRRCQITGLTGSTFIDKTQEGAVFRESRDVATISEYTDRIYCNTAGEHVICNVVSGRKMRMQKYNLPDTVVWNPWAEKAKGMSDFGDDEFPNMICVEAGHVASPVLLPPGTVFEASQILQVI